MVAWNAVQGLGDVSCPLQNDLLRSTEKPEVLVTCVVVFLIVMRGFDARFMAACLTRNACSIRCSRYSGERSRFQRSLVWQRTRFDAFADADVWIQT